MLSKLFKELVAREINIASAFITELKAIAFTIYSQVIRET